MSDETTTNLTAARRSPVLLVLGQLRYQSRLFRRNPRSAFSTFVLPVLILVLINALDGGKRVSGVSYAQVMTPGVAVFGVVSVCYVNLATSLVAARDRGILKRLHGTPLPPWAYFTGRIIFATIVALLETSLMVAIAVAFFGVHVNVVGLLVAAGVVLLGAAALCAVGVLAAAMIPNSDAAPALLSLTYLPLSFVSGVFFPLPDEPAWLQRLAGRFPIAPFARALEAALNPAGSGIVISERDLLTLTAWGLLGAVLAVRRFRWTADESGSRSGLGRLAPLLGFSGGHE